MKINPNLIQTKQSPAFGAEYSEELYEPLSRVCDQVFKVNKRYRGTKHRLRRCLEKIERSMPNSRIYPYIKGDEAYLAVNTTEKQHLLTSVKVISDKASKTVRLHLSNLEEVAEKLAKMNKPDSWFATIKKFFKLK